MYRKDRVAARAGAGHMALPAAVILCASATLANPAAAAPFCPVALPPLAPPTGTGSDRTGKLLADSVSLKDDIAIAKGNVRVEQMGQALEAPRLRYNRQQSSIRAEHGLQYYRPGLYLSAQTADVQIDKRTGQFTGADYTLTTSGGRGQAARVEAVGDHRFMLSDASYTTCPGAVKAWLLSADRIELDRESGRGEAFDTVLRFYDVPIFYSPYLNFPIDDRRHSGILIPTVGYSSDSGFELAVPYYFNLAPNYDATVIPRLMTDRGLQLSGQLRYLTEHHKGEFDAAWLPEDSTYGDSRGLFHFEHLGLLSPHLGIEARFTGVSDDDYFDDLSTDLTETSESHLERSLRLTYEDTGVHLSVLAEGFQNLDEFANNPLAQRANEPYERLPQVRLELVSPTAPFYAGVDTEFTAFESDDGIDAQRTDLRPHVNWDIDHGSWFASSEAALRYTHYRFTDQPGATPAARLDSIDRSIPAFSLGGGLRFVRPLDNGWLQTLEPRVFYLYKGYEDQSEIPLFDTGVPDLHYDRLFMTQRFVGADRIVDANQVTLGLSSRLIEPDGGRTVLKLDLGRIQSFDDPRVAWPGSAETGFGDSGSDYVAGVEYSPSEHFRAGVVAQYDPDEDNLNRARAHVDYRHDSGFRIRLAWRRYEDFRPLRATSGGITRFVPGESETLEQTVVGLSVPMGERLDFVGRWNYSLEKSRNVEILAGLEYRPSCCWASRLSWRRYVSDDDGSYDTAVMFQFVLRGLGSFGETAGSIVDSDIFDDRLAGW